MGVRRDGELLPEFWVRQPRELEREATRGRTRQARQVTDIFTWVQCFGTYVAVVAPVEPLAVPELMAYMGTIVRGLRWVGLGPVRLGIQTPSGSFGEHKRPIIHDEFFWEVGRHSAM